MISPKRVFLLGSSLMFLAVGAGLAITPNRWAKCGEPATRMAAFLPMIRMSAAKNGSANYTTVYDCADWTNAN